MDALSPRQSEVLDFIVAWMDQHGGVPPTFREIGEALEIRSTNGVNDHLRALERKGYISMSEGARCIRLTPAVRGRGDERVMGVPVLGRIAAGQPILAMEDHTSTFFVDRDMLRAQGDVYALQVRGDSMIDDGILDGDFVFVRKTPTAREGEIAACMVNGEATVKRIFREKGRVRLQPANAAMEPIYVRPESGELVVLGVVIGVFRRVH